jgi:hypothetical protein
VKDYRKAGTRAGVEAARSLTHNLRSSAADHGWHPDIVSNVHVYYDGTAMKIHVPKHLTTEVHKLEYGTETTQPTAVFRKFKNRQHVIDKAIVEALGRQLGGKL